MKQIRSARRQQTNGGDEEIILEVANTTTMFSTAIIGFAIAGAIEGLIAYGLLTALNNAEVWDVSPRPLFMISAGVAWRFLRGIDQTMRP